MKTRFAPSPTGFIHLGNARTALLSALFAQAQGGIFLLRIEDTDKQRSTEEYITALCHDLKWLGLHWQEGEEVGGLHQPYRQSDRDIIYEHYYHQLIDYGRAYSCFCTDEELELERKLQKASSQPSRYSGKCKQLTAEQKEKKIAAGIKPALRFAVKHGEEIKFNDLVKGAQIYKAEEIGDFIIRRHDGGSSFMFCNAIDDSLMEVTHVLRGEDHLTQYPPAVNDIEITGLKEPVYAHISLINGSDGAPLSKRNGSRSIRELRQEGFLPIAVANYLARLGHCYEQTELLTWDGLARHFNLKRLGSSAARFDENQLLYWQKTAVKSLSDVEFAAWCGDTLQGVPSEKNALFIDVVRDNVLFPKDIHYYADILTRPSFQVERHRDVIIKAGWAFFESLLAAIDLYGTDFNNIGNFIAEKLGIKSKALFQPVRVALTDELHGPKLGELFQLLGAEEVHIRIHRAGELAKMTE